MSLARRPPGAADVIDLAAARMRDSFGSLLTVCAVPLVPAAALAASSPLWPADLRPAVIAAPLALATVWALAGCGLVLGDGGLGRRPPVVRVLGNALRRLPALAVLLVLATVEVAFYTLLAVVPGVSRLGRLQAAVPVLLLERANPLVALRRSRFLVIGSELLCVRALIGVLLAAVSVAAAPVAVLLAAVPLPAGGSQTLTDTRLLVAAIVVGLIVVPAVASVQFAVFLVRREQLEALDLQLALQALDSATPRRHPTVRAA